jgi:hypothetical protein
MGSVQIPIGPLREAVDGQATGFDGFVGEDAGVKGPGGGGNGETLQEEPKGLALGNAKGRKGGTETDETGRGIYSCSASQRSA